MKSEVARARVDGGEKWEEFDEARADLFREHLRRKNQEERLEEKELRRGEYQKYLESREWQAKRAKVLKRANHICEGCLSRPAVQVHHTTYANVGHELLFELVALCLDCHARAHSDE
jgi:5-methylcytosine-specific restriction endonuclease McrA